MMRLIASRSMARKPASPSSRKISGIVRPVISSMHRSLSTNGSRNRRATLRPSVVLPLQLNPTRIRLSIRQSITASRATCCVTPKIGERFLEAVSRELEAHGVRQHQSHHCFPDDTGRRYDAHVTPLDVGDTPLAGSVVDGRKGMDKR